MAECAPPRETLARDQRIRLYRGYREGFRLVGSIAGYDVMRGDGPDGVPPEAEARSAVCRAMQEGAAALIFEPAGSGELAVDCPLGGKLQALGGAGELEVMFVGYDSFVTSAEPYDERNWSRFELLGGFAVLQTGVFNWGCSVRTNPDTRCIDVEVHVIEVESGRSVIFGPYRAQGKPEVTFDDATLYVQTRACRGSFRRQM